LADTARYGRDPVSLDAAGNPVGLGTVQCGRTEGGIFAPVQAYCNSYGDSLMSGWGKRQYEWQFGLGVQHEIVPRLSGEVTYNKRLYRNLQVTDQLGLGCDRFGSSVSHDQCVQNMLAYSSPTYDFYTVKAPTDPRLPNGGGYTITGLNDQRVAIPGRVRQRRRTDGVQRGDDRSPPELLVARRRHELRVAWPEGHPRQRRHQHGQDGSRSMRGDGRCAERSRPRGQPV
jgi:hypothetical protein